MSFIDPNQGYGDEPKPPANCVEVPAAFLDLYKVLARRCAACYAWVMSKQITQRDLMDHVHYDPETGIFTRKTSRGGAQIGDIAGYLGQNGYWFLSVCGVEQLAHRYAWLYIYGTPVPKFLDHRDGDPLNNRIDNLRPATRRQNQMNHKRGSNNTSGHVGVYWHKPTQSWTAMVFRYGKTLSLGYFSTKEEAVDARRRAAAEEYGEFARETRSRPG